MKPRLIAIVGPTASGKTALAIELARRLAGETLGADSRQVYRGMDIGTAKPTLDEQTAAPHHLIDIVNPDEPFSLARWLELAHAQLDDIWSRGKQPLLVGGTGQYVWALIEGWRVPQVPPQNEWRDEMESRPAVELVEELRRVDPAAGQFIDPRNVRRVIRALEVQQATGKPFSYWRAKEPPAFDTLIIGLRLSREELYRRIDDRVDSMVQGGLMDEVRELLEGGYSRDLPSMSGIGYGEMCGHIAGETDVESAIARTKTGTHRLARHQNAWFKGGDERIRWVDAGDTKTAWRLAQEFVGAPVLLRRQ
jgi:tRNA dimethylallyltransferase